MVDNVCILMAIGLKNCQAMVRFMVPVMAVVSSSTSTMVSGNDWDDDEG